MKKFIQGILAAVAVMASSASFAQSVTVTATVHNNGTSGLYDCGGIPGNTAITVDTYYEIFLVSGTVPIPPGGSAIYSGTRSDWGGVTWNFKDNTDGNNSAGCSMSWVCGGSPTNAQISGGATSAVIPTTGSMNVDLYFSGGCGGGTGPPPVYFPDIDDLSDGSFDPDSDTNCYGMPVWHVSEPYVSLWLKDEPLGYQPAIGPRVSFQLDYKQRESVAGTNQAIFGVGPHWDFSWLSYITPLAIYNKTILFPGGGQRNYFIYSANNYAPDSLTRTSLSGDWTNGFTVLYPDGSKDIYDFVVTNASGAFLEAFLTTRQNPQAQTMQLQYYSYNPASPVARLQYVIDGDGRTNTVFYSTNAPYTNLISAVVDPFGRSNVLSYDTLGRLTNVVDVGHISSSFVYGNSTGYITNLITPYGTNVFAFTDPTTNSPPNGRSVRVTEPDGGAELFLYRDNAPGVLAAYSSYPNTSPFSTSFANNGLSTFNTFHWGRLQYAALSTTNLSSLTTNDFRKARMRHWFQDGFGDCLQTLSVERAPSPDSAGSIEGQKTWYDYVNATDNQSLPTQQSVPLNVARLLPDGTSAFVHTDRNAIGNVLTNVSTWTRGSSVALRTNIFSYDATLGIDLITATNALGVQVSSTSYNAYHEPLLHYDALNQPTSFTYNASQQLTGVTLPTGLVVTNIYGTNNFISQQIAVGFATNSFTYLNDLPVTHTDARGLLVTNGWDNLQRLTNVAYPDATTEFYVYSILDLVQAVDRLSFTNTFVYNNIREKTSQTNALGYPTIFGYCECGALNSIQDALTNVTFFNYDNESRVTNVLYADLSTITNVYDLLGRLTNTVDGAGVKTTNWFNNQGLLIAVSNAYGQVKSIAYDVLDRPTNIVDANGVAIGLTYDNLDRVLTRLYPDGGTEKFGYSAFGLIAYTNQLTNATYFGYDAVGRRIAQTNADNQVIKYAYDGADDLVSLTDGRTNTTQWHYDIFGRVTNKVDATGKTIIVYSYDPDGRLTNRWMMGTNTGYTHDAVGNRKTIVYPSLTITNFYDAVNELTNMLDAVGATKFTWTPIGQLASETGPWASDTVSLGYTQAHRTSLSIQSPSSSSWSQTYSYDAEWRMAGIESSAGAFNYGYAANPSPLIRSLALPNAAYITNAYDNVARLTSTLLANYWGHVLDGYVYGLNPLGLRTNISRNLGLTTNNVGVGYDPINQLAAWSGRETGGATRHNEQLGFGYDAAGNLSLRTNDALVQTFTVDSLNQLSSVSRTGPLTFAGATSVPITNLTVNGVAAQAYGDFTFAGGSNALVNGTNVFTNIVRFTNGNIATNVTAVNLPSSVNLQYDANGNLTNDGTRAFQYDAENQLTNVQLANLQTGAWRVGFVYDGLNRRRIERDYQWGSGTWNLTNETRFIYDGALLVQERDVNNNPSVTYTRGLDLSLSRSGVGGIGGLLARTDTNGSTYYHVDGIGNVTALMDEYQRIVARYVYTPFGKMLGQWGTMASVNKMRFSSMPFNDMAGLSHYPHRFYDPNFQRWLNRDPLSEPGGINLYNFVLNDPCDSLDPLGLSFASGLKSFVVAGSTAVVGGAALVTAVLVAPAVGAVAVVGVGVAAIGAAGYGAYELGIGIRRAVDGVDPYTGQILPVDQIDNAAGAVLGSAAGGLTLGARLSCPVSSGSQNPGVAGTTATDQYFISSGVRRSLSSQMNGVNEIPATIVQDGQADIQTTLNLNQLYSPKFEVSADSRLLNIQPPIRVPIEVQPLGIPGQPASIPLNQVKIVPP